MSSGTTAVIRDRRRPGAPGLVVGLYDINDHQLYEFAKFMVDGQPKRMMIIGRHRRCDIQLSDSTVSFLHCDIVRNADGSYDVLDAESTNGLFVNNIRVERVTLEPGMWLLLGETELVAVGPDKKLPITATSYLTFLSRAAIYYGSGRQAAKHIGKSHATIRRALARWLGRKESP